MMKARMFIILMNKKNIQLLNILMKDVHRLLIMKI